MDEVPSLHIPHSEVAVADLDPPLVVSAASLGGSTCNRRATSPAIIRAHNVTARYTRAVVFVWCLSALPVVAQVAPGTVVLDPAPDITGVIKGGTRPEVVVRG